MEEGCVKLFPFHWICTKELQKLEKNGLLYLNLTVQHICINMQSVLNQGMFVDRFSFIQYACMLVLEIDGIYKKLTYECYIPKSKVEEES